MGLILLILSPRRRHLGPSRLQGAQGALHAEKAAKRCPLLGQQGMLRVLWVLHGLGRSGGQLLEASESELLPELPQLSSPSCDRHAAW
jgi:hypothetical protein